MFGSGDIGAVTEHFVDHFAVGQAKLASSGTALDQVGWDGKGNGQYGFTGVVASGSQSVAEYLGIVLHSSGDTDAVRVFSATSDGTRWIADDSVTRGAGTAGDWAKAVPEPTGGVLLLLGLAGLALERKRAWRRNAAAGFFSGERRSPLPSVFLDKPVFAVERRVRT